MFSLVPALLLLALGEIALRCAYFQVRAKSPLAIWTAIYMAREKASELIYGSPLPSVRCSALIPGSWEALWGPEGQTVLSEFEGRYAAYFAQLAGACREIETPLIVLYIPSTDPASARHVSESRSREFFRGLAAEHGVRMLDVTGALRVYPWDVVTLMPYDGHLSRFGNRIVAERLGEVLTDYPGRRVLVLGDSMTSGFGVPGRDSFPAILQRLNERLEVVNAGVPGYTVVDELQTFRERTRDVVPDVTVLQIDDNDIEGFYAYKLTLWARERRAYRPSENERALLARIGAPENDFITLGKAAEMFPGILIVGDDQSDMAKEDEITGFDFMRLDYRD